MPADLDPRAGAEPTTAPLLVDESSARRLLGNPSAKWMYLMRTRGELPFVQVGGRVMYEPDALARFVAERRKGGRHET
jgi:hypothetical protein